MFYKEINRLQQLDQLIRQQRTGNAHELAVKLKITRRHVYNILEGLRDLGLDIVYDRDRKSFVYKKSYQINIRLGISDLFNHNEMK